jgi:enoyl-CoA hydratase/carnithine racemase
MVNGPALAGACGLVAACDLAIASEKAKFGATEINVGMFPMVMLPALYRAVGRKKALEMGLTGAIFDAHEAERIGLVNRVVPHEELEATVMELANQIKARSTVPIRIRKDGPKCHGGHGLRQGPGVRTPHEHHLVHLAGREGGGNRFHGEEETGLARQVAELPRRRQNG